jgi:GT2 family glycosyltransferase
MNVGIRAARGDIIVRLDGHSRPHPDYVRRCVERLREPGAGVVGGVWEVTPSQPTAAAKAIALAVSSRLGSGGASYRDRETDPTPRDVDTVPFGAYRRSLWHELGGYDESLQVVEDGDFNYRVRQAGYRVILDPATRCTYYSRSTFAALGRQYFRYGWWKMWLLRKHPGATRLRQVIPFGFVTTVLALAFGSAAFSLAAMVLAAVFLAYGAGLLAEALRVSLRVRDVRLWLPLAAAYAVIHFAWGLGGLTHVVTAGRWPPWRSRDSAHPA